jgi:hypothetical protein
MTLIGLELSDAGILAAGSGPTRLLDVDGDRRESPGFAIPETKGLLVGNAAAARAHLFPLQVNNTFWDQLNTEPLEQKNAPAQNHAEIACAHLSLIWENIKKHGDAMIIAVPDYFSREQMGLILGMAGELSIPVKGFVSLPIASSRNPSPDANLIHLDVHMHRFEIAYLQQGEYLTRENSVTVQEINLEQLYRAWVESIAEVFVRNTRFDPLHEAATEQEIYDRLPAALEIFKTQSSFIFEISQGKHSYRITLLRDVLKKKSETLYDEICSLIVKMLDEQSKKGTLTALQLTHRTASLPGLKDKLSEIDNCQIMELEPGAGARGALQFWGQMANGHTGDGASFFTRRPWQQTEQSTPQTIPYDVSEKREPTHVLYQDTAYPLSEKTLVIGSDHYPAGTGIHIQTQSSSLSRKHCTIQREGDRIVLRDYSKEGTFVDDQRINGSIALAPGQVVRLGSSGETVRLISCMESDET